MESLFIGATKSSPMVRLDPEAGLLEITGKSYPENASRFYTPVFEWIKEFLKTAEAKPIDLNLEIIYLNSSSSKVLLNLLDILDQAAVDGNRIVINWRYHEENETALECGEEFAEEVANAAFNLVEIDDD